MTDLNTAIVDFKGWKSFGNYCVAPWVQYDSDENIINHSVDKPDYEHDANLYMALFEEMAKDGDVDLDFTNFLNEYKVHFFTNSGNRGGAIGKSIGTAICLAYCKLKGIKVV